MSQQKNDRNVSPQKKQAHPNKGYGPLESKRCNKYLKFGLNHRSSDRNVCKVYLPFKSQSWTS